MGSSKKRREKGSFLAIPHAVLHSKNYAKLSFKAKSLLVDLSSQIVFRKGGDNTNGDLTACLRVMKTMGWRSSDTLDAAEAELLHYGFIEVTQQGNRRHPTLYAVTWLAISDFEDKPWISPTNAPSSKWRCEVEPMLPRRPGRKKPNPDDWIIPRLIVGSRFFSIPENWVNGYPTIGLNVQKVINLYPRIGLKTGVFDALLYPRIGYLYRSSHRHKVAVAVSDTDRLHPAPS